MTKLFQIFNNEPKRTLYWYSGYHTNGTPSDLSHHLKGAKHGVQMVMIREKLQQLEEKAFNGVKFQKSVFLSCNFSGMNMKKTQFFYCNFYNCNFENSTFDDCRIFKCTFQFCQLAKTNFKNSFLEIVDDFGSDFAQASFPRETALQKRDSNALKIKLNQNLLDTSPMSSMMSTQTLSSVGTRREFSINYFDEGFCQSCRKSQAVLTF